MGAAETGMPAFPEQPEAVDPLEVLVSYQTTLLKYLNWNNPHRYYFEDDLNLYESQIESFKDQLDPREFARYAFSIAIICAYTQFYDLSRRWLAWAEEKAPPDVADEINATKKKHSFIENSEQS